MQDEVEDGELIDSDVETSSQSRNGKDTLKSTFWHGVPVSGGGCELGYMKTLNSKIMTSRRRPEGLPSSESESDEPSDKSDDEKPVKRRMFASNIQQNSVCRNADVVAGSFQSVLDQDCSNARNRNLKQQKNNIWASVVQDQILSSEMSGWSGLEQPTNNDRSVESYNYMKAKENNLVVSVPTFEAEHPVADAHQEVVPDIGDIETFGTISKNGKKVSSRRDASPDGSGEGKKTHGAGKPWLKRNHRGGECHGSAYNRLGSRGFDPSRDRDQIGVTSADEPSAVVQELLRVLREPDGMKDTFTRVVETVGVDEALKYLCRTEAMEAAGGLMTLDGRRRRTPGGVYLYLVKTEVSKEQQSVIFQYQNTKQRKRTVKAERSRKLAALRQSMEEALGLNTNKDTSSTTEQTMETALGLDIDDDTISATAAVNAEARDLRKPDMEVMEEEEANGDDCLTNPDPSTNIELD